MTTRYLVKMIRYGNEYGHTYICGLADSKAVGQILGINHGKFYRGGKYEYELIEVDLPEEVSTIYIEMDNMEQDKGEFRYTIHTDKNAKLNSITIEEFMNQRKTIWDVDLGTRDTVLNDPQDLSEFIERLNWFPEEAQQLIKDKYEEQARKR